MPARRAAAPPAPRTHAPAARDPRANRRETAASTHTGPASPPAATASAADSYDRPARPARAHTAARSPAAEQAKARPLPHRQPPPDDRATRPPDSPTATPPPSAPPSNDDR